MCRSRSAQLAAAFALATTLAGCGNLLDGQACTADFRYGISISVLDRATGLPVIEGIAGEVRDGSYVETMEVFFENQLVGAGERAGTYDVSVTALGYAPWSQQNVDVDKDECHVEQRTLTATLDSL